MPLFQRKDANSLVYDRCLVKTRSLPLPPEYIIGSFIHQKEDGQKDIELELDAERLKNELKLMELGDSALPLEQLKQMIHKQIWEIKNTILYIKPFAPFRECEVHDSVSIIDVLLFFHLFRCEIKVEEAGILIRIPQRREAVYIDPNASEQQSQIVKQMQEDRYTVFSLFKHLLKQPQYIDGDFMLEEPLADLFMTPIVYQFKYDKLSGVLLNTQEETTVNTFTNNYYTLQGYDYQKLLSEIEQFKNQQESISEYNLVKNQNSGLFQVVPPYNIRRVEELRRRLRTYTIKESTLQQFAQREEYLNGFCLHFLVSRETIKLDGMLEHEAIKFEVDGLEDVFYEIRRRFCFSSGELNRHLRKEVISAQTKEYMRQEYERYFKSGGNATINKEDKDVISEGGGKSDQWLNTHMTGYEWYRERYMKVNGVQNALAERAK